MTFANAELTFYRRTCFKGRTVLGLRNKLNITAQGSLRGFFPLSRSLPLQSSSFSRSLFLSRSQFIEALGTCHLSMTRRGRAYSTPVSGITDVSEGEETQRRKEQKAEYHETFCRVARGFETTNETAESSRELEEASSPIDRVI